jgi:hypothetical protein
MAEGFRYALTRICLRTGSLTLPLNLLGVFPDRGEVLATDTGSDAEFTLQVLGRRVLGFADYFAVHRLDPNDELLIEVLDDGRYAITATKRPAKPERPSLADRGSRLIDALLAHGAPVSEGEIRGLFPDLVADLPLRPVLEAEARLVRKNGRWQSRLSVSLAPAEDEVPERIPEVAVAPTPIVSLPAERPLEVTAEAPTPPAVVPLTPSLAPQERAVGGPLLPAEAPADPLDFARQRTREQLAAHAESDALAAARQQRNARAAERRSGAAAEEVETFAWDQPVVRRLRFPWTRRREEQAATAEPKPSGEPLRLDRLGEARPVERPAPAPPTPRVTAAPRANLFADEGPATPLPPGDQKLSKRARDAFTALGYRVEGLAYGQLMLHADYGRRVERILVHVLPEDQRLPWGALLQRRREAGASHLAVIGHQRDLQPLTAPADLARATLWSWDGLERVLEVARTMALGPFDLQVHFDRDGMFDYGLDHFERAVAKRLQERAALSVILERLALMKAPAVFLLEEIASEVEVPREATMRVLERLADAPWHLVARVDSGEFSLRYRVEDALEQVQAYALMLRERLPGRQRDLVRGFDEGVDPIMGDEVVADEGEGIVGDALEQRVRAKRGR